tara:strand:+ start:319 stop:828 length:510 start_codon:yes stop_codon:yes gene_type:complete
MARTWQQELHHNAKKRAKRKGIVFTILKEEIHIPSYCPLLGIPLMKNPNGRYQWDNSATIDKIDNNKGYVVGNVWVVSSLANLIMSSATAEQIIAVGEGLKAKQTEMAMKYTEEQVTKLERIIKSRQGSNIYVNEDGDIELSDDCYSTAFFEDLLVTIHKFDKDNGIGQ